MQDNNLSGEDNDNIDWDTEDELEIQDTRFSSCADLRTTEQHAAGCDGEVNAFSLYLVIFLVKDIFYTPHPPKLNKKENSSYHCISANSLVWSSLTGRQAHHQYPPSPTSFSSLQ